MNVYYFDKDGVMVGEGTSATCPSGATEIAPTSMEDIWNGKIWVSPPQPTLLQVKQQKIMEILNNQKNELDIILGAVASAEISSFVVQEKEAREWNADNTVSTPFVDALLVSRNLGETKQELVDKIIAKADAYTVVYADMLGKFQRLIKQVQAATTVDEVKAISW